MESGPTETESGGAGSPDEQAESSDPFDFEGTYGFQRYVNEALLRLDPYDEMTKVEAEYTVHDTQWNHAVGTLARFGETALSGERERLEESLSGYREGVEVARMNLDLVQQRLAALESWLGLFGSASVVVLRDSVESLPQPYLDSRSATPGRTELPRARNGLRAVQTVIVQGQALVGRLYLSAMAVYDSAPAGVSRLLSDGASANLDVMTVEYAVRRYEAILADATGQVRDLTEAWARRDTRSVVLSRVLLVAQEHGVVHRVHTPGEGPPSLLRSCIHDKVVLVNEIARLELTRFHGQSRSSGRRAPRGGFARV